MVTKGLGISIDNINKPKTKTSYMVDKIIEAVYDCKGLKDITAPSSSSSSSSSSLSHDNSQAVATSSGNDGSGVVSSLRSEVEASRYDKAYEILMNKENCKKGKFEALCEYLEDELGVSNGDGLKKCTQEWHVTIGEYLKGIYRNEYMSL